MGSHVPWYAFGRAAERETLVALPLVGFEEAPSLDAFRSALGPSDSLDRFFPRRDGPTPGVDAIRYWAGEATVPAGVESNGVRDGLVAWNDGLTLVEDGEPRCAFWHHESSFAIDVPAGYESLDLEYVPSGRDGARNSRLVSEWGYLAGQAAHGTVSTILEVSGVFGSSSFKLHDLLSPGELAKGAFRVSLKVATLPFKLFGGAVTTVGEAMHTEADGAFPGRLEHEERTSGAVATDIPRLTAALEPPKTGAIAVIVHGFASCAVPAARALMKSGYPAGMPTYRFEHDTFLSPRENARALAKLIRALPDTRILLICHSRGGLVARYAIAGLPDRDASIVTLGTPHQGTPIASSWGVGARQALRMANSYSYETQATGGEPHPDSLARGYVPRRFPPPGLDALRPNSAFFQDLAEDAPPNDRITAYGADFRPGESGGGLKALGAEIAAAFGSGLFGGEPNDIVVSTASATAVTPGHGHRLTRSCTHFGYFADPEVLTALEAAAVATLQPEKTITVEIRNRQKRLKANRPNFKLPGRQPDDD
jgi:pimeloyl-ACP methyl ester carboxylesterase